MTDEELTKKYDKHSFAVFRLDSKLNVESTYSSKHEDLISLIARSRRYFVDRSIPWKDIASRSSNKSTLFILGRTMLDEDPDIGHLFKRKLLTSGNLLVMFPYPSEGGFEIHLHRMDESLPNLFSEEGRELVKQGAETYQKWVSQRNSDIRMEKQEVLHLLNVNALSELSETAEANIELINSLSGYIQHNAQQCLMRFGLAGEVARRCYAFLLASNFPRIRNEFEERDYINVFGDTAILQNALFLSAGILTADKALRRMADAAGLDNDIETVAGIAS